MVLKILWQICKHLSAIVHDVLIVSDKEKPIRLFRIISIPSTVFFYFGLPDHVILMEC
jgi:hypothetical protein